MRAEPVTRRGARLEPRGLTRVLPLLVAGLLACLAWPPAPAQGDEVVRSSRPGRQPGGEKEQPPEAASPAPEFLRIDPRFDSLIPPGSSVEIIAGGFTWTEGPVWREEEGALFFSDIPGNAVYRWEPAHGARLFLHPSGYSGKAPFTGREPGSNGLLFDGEGRLILCEHGDRRVARIEPDGTRTILADRFEGRRLNSPNDAVLRSDGRLFFTDPPFGLPATFVDPEKELPFSGVFSLSAGGRLTLLTTELTHPNGIALSPSERTLYISDAVPERPRYFAFDVHEDGRVGAGRLLFDATPFASKWPGSADGIEVDRDGYLYVAGPGGIHVLSPEGSHLGSVILGGATSNLAWARNGRALIVTAGPSVFMISLPR